MELNTEKGRYFGLAEKVSVDLRFEYSRHQKATIRCLCQRNKGFHVFSQTWKAADKLAKPARDGISLPSCLCLPQARTSTAASINSMMVKLFDYSGQISSHCRAEIKFIDAAIGIVLVFVLPNETGS